jgi:hypothetical protein
MTFSEKMILNNSISWINYTDKQNFNISWINKSNTIMKIIPSNGRDQDFGFNFSQLRFSWNVSSVKN